MKIITHSIDDYERLYCPSTGEVIFSIWNEFIEYRAIAVAGYWNDDGIEEPKINDNALQARWNSFLEAKTKNGGLPEWEEVIAFLRDFDNDDWIVYDCSYNISVAGTFCFCFVVKKDAIFEDDPDYTDEEGYEDNEEEES